MAQPLHQHIAKFEIKVDGAPLTAGIEDLLVSALVEDNLALPDMFRLVFRDPRRAVLGITRIKIGSVVAISVVSEGAPSGEPLLTGEVTALEAEYDDGGTFTVVRGFDHSHRLFRGRTTATYPNTTYSDVVAQVTGRAGLATGRIDATTGVQPHITQANMCDWQFLSLIAQETGYEVAVVKGKLEFRRPTDSTGGPGKGSYDSTNPLQLVYGANLLRFHASVTAAEQVKEVQVRGWDARQKRAVVGTAPGATTSAALSVSPASLAGTFGGPTHVTVDVPYGSQAEVDNAAKAVAERIAGAFAELDGTALGNPKLRAGTAVSLSLAGAPFDGKYRLTATRHLYDPHDGYTTSFVASGRQERSLLGLTSPGVNGSAPGVRLIAGVVIAVVTDVKDPDNLGRVKLRFPWLSDSYVTDWVRTVQAGAGISRGAVFLPEVNDEVLVAFEQGDVSRPFVIGGLWNGVDQPPLGPGLVDPATGAVKRRGFVSKKAGALIFFDDAVDEGVALLTGDKKHRISLNKTMMAIRITSGGKVEISGALDVTIKAGTNLTVEAGALLELKGAMVSISANGPVQVKGNPIQLN
ncbi:MAG: VgrG-related protein [Egibacteraceae bacterium]